MRFFTSIILLIIIRFNTAQSQILNPPTISIKGNCKDQKGQNIANVAIRLKETKAGILSNNQGEFLFENLQPSTYTIIASYVGYQTIERSFNLKEGKSLELRLELIETGEMLNEITVTGYLNSNEKPIEIGKIAIRPMDLPQSVATIDQKVLEQQQVRTLSDVLANTNGVYIMGTTGGYQEEIAARGFAFGSNNTFKNGMRYFNGMLIETTGLEKVEIMKGSAAILFGNVSAGGVLNIITKKPKYALGGELSFKTGSFGLVKPSFDIYSGIGKKDKLAFRLNGTYEKANSFRVAVSSERFYLNPSLIYKFSKNTSLLLEGDFLKDERTPDFGAGNINYQIVDIPREKFLGIAWSNFKAQQSSATASFNHNLSENWKISAIVGLRKYDTELFSNTRPNSGVLIKADGTWIRNVQKTEVSDNYKMAEVDLRGNFRTNNVGHEILFGFDTDAYTTITNTFNTYSNYDTLNIFGTRQYKIRTDQPAMGLGTLTTAPVSRIGMYVQDLVSLGKYVKALVGLRYSYQDTQSNVLTISKGTTVTTRSYDKAFTPRLGLIFQPNQFHSVFASYASSFTPNAGVDVSGNALKPSIIDQYEVGIKNELFNGKLSANATIYRILNNNLAQISLTNGNANTNVKELAGSVESKGVEIDIVARPN